MASPRPYTPSRGIFSGRNFPSRKAYRNALSRRHGYKDFSAQQRAIKRVRNPTDLATLKPSEREAYQRVREAVDLSRNEGITIERARQRVGASRSAVDRYGRSAIARDARGRRIAKPVDHLLRRVSIVLPSGRKVTLNVRDSRTASLIGKYKRAVREFRLTRDPNVLRQFRHRGFRVEKKFYPFITDPEALDYLEVLGVEDQEYYDED